MAKCSNFGLVHFPYQKHSYFLRAGTQQRSQNLGAEFRTNCPSRSKWRKGSRNIFFLWSCSYAWSVFIYSGVWTLPTAWRWYITLIRLRVTQRKHGRATSELGFLIVSLCSAWILGLLYQGKKKKKKTSKWMEKKTKRYSKFLICLHDWPQKWWTCFPLVFSIT